MVWAEIETAIGDFESTDNALKYFNLHYKIENIFERCFFAEVDNEIVGTCIAWYDFKESEECYHCTGWQYYRVVKAGE